MSTPNEDADRISADINSDFFGDRSDDPRNGAMIRAIWIIPNIFVPIQSVPKPRTPTLPTSQPDAYAEWGGPSDFADFNQTFDEIVERRETGIVRVTNSEDDSQFVDVEVISKASFQNPDLGNRMKLRFG